MAITVAPNPVNLQWSNFRSAPTPPDEEAHIDINFNVPNRPFRRVNGRILMAETFQIGVSPNAKVRQGASQTADLLSHEQGHYNLGILVAWAMAHDFMQLEAANSAALGNAIRACFNLHKDTRMRSIQQKYDRDTNHSRNRQQQQRWDRMISQCMSARPRSARVDNLPF
jgi:hypothetical protein